MYNVSKIGAAVALLIGTCHTHYPPPVPADHIWGDYSFSWDKVWLGGHYGCRYSGYFEFEIDGVPLKKPIIWSVSKDFPLASDNFARICVGDKIGLNGKPLKYDGTKAYKNYTGKRVMMGDVTKNDGTGGESIYGRWMNDEKIKGWSH
jgi:cyclophilin family peptidyl-prolyl cis-trans isomerase